MELPIGEASAYYSKGWSLGYRDGPLGPSASSQRTEMGQSRSEGLPERRVQGIALGIERQKQ